MVVIYKVSAGDKSHAIAKTALFSSCGLVVSHGQFYGILGGFDVPYPEVFQNLMDIFQPFLFKMRQLAPNCFFGYQGLGASYVPGTLSPALILMLFASLWGISQVANKVNQQIPGMRMNSCVNSSGVVINALFVGVVKSVFNVLEYRANPSAPDTLLHYEGYEWNLENVGPMLPVTILFSLLYVVSMVCIYAYVIYFAPSLFHVQENFQVRWRWLLGRWNPRYWFWGGLFMLRNLSMALINIVTMNGLAQVYIAFIIVMLYLIGTAWCQPWKEHAGNRLDTLMSLCLMLVLVGSIAFMPSADGAAQVVVETIMVLSVGSAIAIFLLIASHLLCIMGGIQRGILASDELLREDFLRVVNTVSEYHRLDPDDAAIAVTDFLQTLPEKDYLAVRWVTDVLSSGLLGVANTTMKGIKPKMSDSAKRMSVGTGSQDLVDFQAAQNTNLNEDGPAAGAPGTAWAEK